MRGLKDEMMIINEILIRNDKDGKIKKERKK